MAETAIHLTGKDVATLKFKDGTGTPLTYTVKLTEGTLTIIDGEYEHSVAEEMSGEVISGGAPRQAGIRSRCGVTFSGKVFDVGEHATDVTLLDVLNLAGVVGSTWISTTNTVEASMKTLDLEIVVSDRTYAGPTVIKGGTFTFDDCRKEGNATIDITPGGWVVTGLTMRSTTTVKYGMTRTS